MSDEELTLVDCEDSVLMNVVPAISNEVLLHVVCIAAI